MAVRYTGVNISGLEWGPFGSIGTHGVEYISHDQSHFDYWNDQGANIVRFAFSWERIQNQANGPLNEEYLGYLRMAADGAAANGQILILDMHNYATYFNNTFADDNGALKKAYGDVWARLANEFKDDPNVWFGIMNEPHDISAYKWVDYAQMATDSIRAAGAGNKILMPVVDWAHASNFNEGNTFDQGAYNIYRDPADNFAWEIHQYLDPGGEGNETNAIAGMGGTVLEGVVDWARARGVELFLGEFPVSATGANQPRESIDLLNYMEANGDVILGWTVWAAGQWWAPNAINVVGPGHEANTNIIRPFFTDAPAEFDNVDVTGLAIYGYEGLLPDDIGVLSGNTGGGGDTVAGGGQDFGTGGFTFTGGSFTSGGFGGGGTGFGTFTTGGFGGGGGFDFGGNAEGSVSGGFDFGGGSGGGGGGGFDFGGGTGGFTFGGNSSFGGFTGSTFFTSGGGFDFGGGTGGGTGSVGGDFSGGFDLGGIGGGSGSGGSAGGGTGGVDFGDIDYSDIDFSGATQGIRYTGVNMAGLEFGAGIGSHGTEYISNGKDNYDFWAQDVGANVIRFQFTWERLQHNAFGNLDQEYLGYIKDAVSYAAANNMVIAIDMHNFAEYFGTRFSAGNTALKNAYADVWGKLAAEFGDDANVWFDIMNEPHDIDAQVWVDHAQAATNAIRATGAGNKILVPTVDWSGADNFLQNNTYEKAAYATYNDPADNYAWQVHQYLDSNGSGGSPDAVPGKGAGALQGVADWARQTGQEIFLGEFGIVANNASSVKENLDMLNFVHANSDVFLGWSAWAAGEWWGNYQFAVGPGYEANTNLLRPYMAGQFGNFDNEAIAPEVQTVVVDTADTQTQEAGNASASNAGSTDTDNTETFFGDAFFENTEDITSDTGLVAQPDIDTNSSENGLFDDDLDDIADNGDQEDIVTNPDEAPDREDVQVAVPVTDIPEANEETDVKPDVKPDVPEENDTPAEEEVILTLTEEEDGGTAETGGGVMQEVDVTEEQTKPEPKEETGEDIVEDVKEDPLDNIQTIGDPSSASGVNEEEGEVEITTTSAQPDMQENTNAPVSNTITIQATADYYCGNAVINVLLDNEMLVTREITASRANGESETFDIHIDKALTDTSNLEIRFVNDLYAGSAGYDRNVYLKGVEVNGHQLGLDTATMNAAGEMGESGLGIYSNGGAFFSLGAVPNETAVETTETDTESEDDVTEDDNTATDTTDTTDTTETGDSIVDDNAAGDTDTGTTTPEPVMNVITIEASADRYKGNPVVEVRLDGERIATHEVDASRKAGATERFDIEVEHDITPFSELEIRFVNDAFAGHGKDRNVYIKAVEVNGTALDLQDADVSAKYHGYTDAGLGLYSKGSAFVGLSTVATTDAASVPDTGTDMAGAEDSITGSVIHIQASGDLYGNEDPMLGVYVNGQMVHSEHVSANRKAGQVEDIEIKLDNYIGSDDTIELTYTNDAWGGHRGGDRNLNIKSISVDGVDLDVSHAEVTGAHDVFSDRGLAMYSNGDAKFDMA